MGREVIKDFVEPTLEEVAELVQNELTELRDRQAKARSLIEMWTVANCALLIRRVEKVRSWADWQAYVAGR